MSNNRAAELRSQVFDLITHHPQGILTKDICGRLQRTPQELGDVFEDLIDRGEVIGFAGLWVAENDFQVLSRKFLAALDLFHSRNPSVVLADVEDIANMASWTAKGKPLDRMANRLRADGFIYKSDGGIRASAFRPVLPERHRQFLDRVVAILKSESINTANPHQISQILHVPSLAVAEILKIGVDAGEIIEPANGVFYTEAQMELLHGKLLELAADGQLSASTVRDVFGTSRKYAVALLTHFFPRDGSGEVRFTQID